MAAKKNDFFNLYDPSQVTGDSIAVNVIKKRAFVTYGIALAVVLFMLFMCVQNHLPAAGAIFILIMAIIVIVGMIGYYLKKNPVLIIDKTGITYENKSYSWESITHVKCNWDDGNVTISSLDLYLKNKKYFTIHTDYLDQPLEVWANYIIKYILNT